MTTTPPPTYSVSTLDGVATDLKHALTEATTPVAAAEKPLHTKHLNVENPVPVNVFVSLSYTFSYVSRVMLLILCDRTTLVPCSTLMRNTSSQISWYVLACICSTLPFANTLYPLTAVVPGNHPSCTHAHAIHGPRFIRLSWQSNPVCRNRSTRRQGCASDACVGC